MTPRRLTRLPGWVTAGLVIVTALWAGFLDRAHLAGERSPLDRAEAEFADIRLLIAGRRAAPAEIVIVAIDDKTVAREKGYPLHRMTLAKLILAIGASKPRALAIDLLFVDPAAPEADQALAKALEQIPSVIAAAALFDRQSPGTSQVPSTSDVLWPAPPFDSLAAIGLVNVSTDPSGAPRHVPLLFQTDRGLVPSFVLRAAALFAGEDPVLAPDGVRIAGASTKLDVGRHLPLRFYGPRGTLDSVSASDVLAGEIPATRLQGRIVVVGVTATAVGDTFGTAFDPVTPGVEVLATGIAQLTGGPGLVRDGTIRLTDATVTLALALGSVLVISLAPIGIGLNLAALLLGAWLLVTIALFAEGYWFSAALPLAGVLPPAALATMLRQVWDRRQTREIRRAEAALRQFQPPVLAERIAQDPNFLLEPILQTAAILFVDLSGFTRLSEQVGPAQTREFLQEFHSLVENEIAAHQGLVMSFMGDGAMIVFGIPDTRPDDASRAFDAAWALIKATRGWIDGAALDQVVIGNKGLENGFRKPLPTVLRHALASSRPDIRVGAHFGPVIVSRLGHESHQHITASGDSVNVASRLMELAKTHGAMLAVSAEFLAARGESGGQHPEPDEVCVAEIRGRRQPMTVAFWSARFR